MARPRTPRRLLLAALTVAPLVALPGTASAGPESGATCYDPAASLTVEERRLDATLEPGGPAVGPELVRQAGFDRQVDRFVRDLCRVRTRGQAERLVTERGRELWRTAVDRAQGRRPDLGGADRYDDRPLYWARLHLTRAVRQWRAPFALDAARRAELVRTLDRAARGIDSVRLPADPHVRRVLVSGFDPFRLDGQGVRTSNPSGAAALQLDGRTFDTPHGRVVVEAVTLPVLWGGFDEGVVEAAYGPWLRAGRRQVDMITTISQGRPERFDIERWAGRWRGGSPDNDAVRATGPAPAAAGWPQPAHEFIETTLPWQRMVEAGTGPYAVALNREFCEWPVGGTPGTGQKACRTDEPTPGAAAAAGSGGDYLSNESMYRANRLRLGLGATDVRGGHLHTPVLGLPDSGTALTDPAFERRRRAIADQTVALVRAGASAP
ncbi:Pyrrolidone-carboxylate peptidase (N-terminal pyroglutamyl peptidase) [Streptoalloteichus tenebrarius]|uniref:Pyrrolidone-carboxylate peptidase (N-terminal pyroglutamyl peptidase) n=1 Tax=Streptoalloteichus tenebrarius (strain ATCC 17920 / DSM 40477 / JCM 4838 / CBS 697.72 / NBRC 16177 / NCIMB 11028 / NRRL B-12390 / A12253. 1 / ISP 5477) TaxID=1933 RepID=A0ABT1HMY8_STRSD|nr:hypothetical protein [Streptoalloteichus tenebrarius]MCP2256868.1 Pyrrolidone-carboxylate peptidase (N-terminal pyroglutamyl peptidase) [Streptoalloteichus tenebrarius]BFF00224.1 hypothetical protein GCM10020241_18990 [Streptoalloteichus tenebrarius]